MQEQDPMNPDLLCAEVEGQWDTLMCHGERVLAESVFGLSIGQLLAAAGIFLGFMLLRRLISKVFIAVFKRLVAKTKTTFDDEVLDSIEAPLALIPVILGIFFASEYILALQPALADSWEGTIARVIQSLISIVIFWSLFNMVTPVSHLLTKLERLLTRTMLEWIEQALKTIFIVVGAGAVLEIWGIPVGPLVASLGLFGVAVALGAQDLFRNLIGGISILVEQRFHVGDWILVDGVVEGTVEQIGFRSTFIRQFDKAPVFVPNDVLSNSAMTNFSDMTHRRIYWKIGLEYRTTIEQLKQIRQELEDYILETEAFADPKEVSTFIRIDALSDSSIDIMLYCFTTTTNWGEWLEIKEQLAYRLKEIVEGAGSGFAFPSQSLYVESLPGDGPEVFIPPKDL
jgi:MscS family membrane protein